MLANLGLYRNVMRTKDLEYFIKQIADKINQDSDNSLRFMFSIVRGNETSERLISWFDEHNAHEYLLFSDQTSNVPTYPDFGEVYFRDRPDLAVLFKMTFV